VGSAQLATTGAVDGFAIFTQTTQQEAGVPMTAQRQFICCLSTTPMVWCWASLWPTFLHKSKLQVVARDYRCVDGSKHLSSLRPAITQFGLAKPITITANIRGTVEFDTHRQDGSAC
jgi:hypothetical protein